MPDPSAPLKRYPCAWCAEPGRWPDRCSSDDPVCAEIIADSCDPFGDHRRCGAAECPVAARWHSAVRSAGVQAARAAGAAWAVVSIIGDRLRVVGTSDHLGRAKSLLRTGAIKRAGLPLTEGKGRVYVVRATDGAFL